MLLATSNFYGENIFYFYLGWLDTLLIVSFTTLLDVGFQSWIFKSIGAATTIASSEPILTATASTTADVIWIFKRKMAVMRQ